MNCCNANGQCTQGADCPARPALDTPKPARVYRCDELGVCNCPGPRCAFELPDLGPMTPAERVLLVVISVASAAIAISLGSWLYFKHGAAITQVVYLMANRLS